MTKVRALVFIAAVVLLICQFTASADDSPICRFTGIATLDGANVPDGTVITAIIGNDEYSTITPTGYGPSTYSTAIYPPEGIIYPDGTAVYFTVDGYKAQQTGTLYNGENIRCDLTATTTPTQAAPTNIWLIFGLVAASIVEVLLVGGVARIVLRSWNR